MTEIDVTKFGVTKFDVTKFGVTKFDVTKFGVAKFDVMKFDDTKRRDEARKNTIFSLIDARKGKGDGGDSEVCIF